MMFKCTLNCTVHLLHRYFVFPFKIVCIIYHVNFCVVDCFSIYVLVCLEFSSKPYTFCLSFNSFFFPCSCTTLRGCSYFYVGLHEFLCQISFVFVWREGFKWILIIKISIACSVFVVDEFFIVLFSIWCAKWMAFFVRFNNFCKKKLLMTV